MNVGRRDQVGAADDVRHPHRGVVERAREMIAGGGVLAREDDVAMCLAVGGAKPLSHFFPHKFASLRHGARHVEPPAMRLGRDAPFTLALGQRAARSGVDGAGRAVRRRQAGGDVGARAKTGIDEAARSQIVERGGIGAEPARLAYGVAVPIEAEPFEVGERCRDIIFARTAAVDIVDADAEKPARAARGNVRKHRAIGVAEVELAGRAGGETRQHGAS